MASLTHENGKRTGWRLRAYAVGDSRTRRSVWLGDMPQGTARQIKAHVEAIIDAQKFGSPMPAETQRWLAAQDRTLQDKLSPITGTIRTVKAAVSEFLSFDSQQNKPSTVDAHTDTLDPFVQRFGSRGLRSLTALEIDRWLAGFNVGPSTIGKHAKTLKRFFRWCAYKQWMPNLTLQTASTIGVGKKAMVGKEFNELVSSFKGDQQTQAALRIARWSGLRVPSELLVLTIASVDLEAMRLHIPDCKRSRRASRGPPVVRETPIFPELQPTIVDLLNIVEGGPEDPLLPGIVAIGGSCFVGRIRKRRDELGLEWPRLFTSIRATRETELIERFGVRAACEWIGNSPAIASRNYEMVSDEVWESAVSNTS